MSTSDKQALTVGATVVLVFVGMIAWLWHEAETQPTTYCTEWTRAVSIEPTNSDNGKHADEQYVVKYEDGSMDGQDQGGIPFARCTNKVDVHESKAKSNWKVVDSYGDVDWEQ